MKASKSIIWTLRDAPNDAVIASHQLMMRSGMIRKLGNGLYAYMPLGYRSLMKVQKIIREELDKAGLLEIKPTVIQPGDLWRESGRWDKMSGEMLTAQNRQGQDMVVSPTAEEAFTALVREGISSYKQLPFTLYQINTKYRDEIRPRYGVMRGREFNMADGYSLHADDESLDATYQDYAKICTKTVYLCKMSYIENALSRIFFTFQGHRIINKNPDFLVPSHGYVIQFALFPIPRIFTIILIWYVQRL